MTSLRPFLSLSLTPATITRTVFTRKPLPSHLSVLTFTRLNSSSSSSNSDRPIPPLFTGPRPAPFKLDDPKEQALFEELLARSTGAFSSSIDERASAITHARETLHEVVGGELGGETDTKTQTAGYEEQEQRHPDAPKKATPEFEGEKNPRTGEVGGPKVEPLKWGGESEWTYNGRATDF